jgi:hypothetical protein
MPSAPEYWSADVGPADVALLEVPPAVRSREFQLDVRSVVRCPGADNSAWHALTVEVDGRREWSRRIPTSNPGQTDSLDYQRRVEVGAGQGLRIRAVVATRASQRVQLRIEAQEQGR